MKAFSTLSVILILLYLGGYINRSGNYIEWMSRDYTNALKGFAILTVLWAHAGAWSGVEGIQFIAGIGVVLTRADTLPPTPCMISGSVIKSVPTPSQTPTTQSITPNSVFVFKISDIPCIHPDNEIKALIVFPCDLLSSVRDQRYTHLTQFSNRSPVRAIPDLLRTCSTGVYDKLSLIAPLFYHVSKYALTHSAPTNISMTAKHYPYQSVSSSMRLS